MDVFLDFYRMFLDVLISVGLIGILFLTVLFIFIFMLLFGHYFLYFTFNVTTTTIYIFVCFIVYNNIIIIMITLTLPYQLIVLRIFISKDKVTGNNVVTKIIKYFIIMYVFIFFLFFFPFSLCNPSNDRPSDIECLWFNVIMIWQRYPLMILINHR